MKASGVTAPQLRAGTAVLTLKTGVVVRGRVTDPDGKPIKDAVVIHGNDHYAQTATHKFVTDAREVVKTGDIVRVQVQEVDLERKRISLTMKLGQVAPVGPSNGGGGQGAVQTRANGPGIGHNSYQPASRGQRPQPGQAQSSAQGSAMAAAFAKLQR